MMRSSFKLGAAVLLGLLLAFANTASARTLTMNGEWFQNRGPLVDIPANGGAVLCGGPPSTGCVNNLRPLNGGIPASSVVVSVTGSGPASFSIASSEAFGLPGGANHRQTIPVNGIPTVIQLASQFKLQGPANVITLGGEPAGGAATFQKNAWSNDPRQAARLGANFTWCPPTGNCATTTYSLTYGAFQAVMQYTAGENSFGGTMAMMLRDTGVVSINLGGTPARVLHQLVGGTSNPSFAPQMGGAGYAAARQLTLANGPVFASYTIGVACTSGFGQEPSPPGCGVITNQGAFLFSLPGSINYDFGMPWTTGTVKVKNLPGPVPTQDPATTFTIEGSDSRHFFGGGQITLVAGATTERSPSSNHFAGLEVVTMNFARASVPLLSPAAIAALLTLMLLAGGYMARRKFTIEDEA
jgi:hypothetical protein